MAKFLHRYINYMKTPIIKYNDKFLDRIGLFMRIGGITLWPFIILREIYDASPPWRRKAARIINHESIHIAQYRELFVIGFYLIYVWDFITGFIKFRSGRDAYYSIRFERDKHGYMLVDRNFKVFNKEIISEKNYWLIKASHDAYLKPYGIIHERKLNYFHDDHKLEGRDKLIKSKGFKICNFAIRFHLLPEIKLTKLINNESILIESKNSGWKFTCKNYRIDIETGLYFGIKNKYLENKNILVTGITSSEDQNINWKISKI